MRRSYVTAIAESLYVNRGVGQTIVKNVLWLGLAQGFVGFVNFLLGVLAIRRFEEAKYGTFAVAFSFVGLFSAIFDFGLSTAATREFARDKGRESAFIGLLIWKVLFGFVVVGVVYAGAFVLMDDAVTRRIIFVLAFYIFTQELLNLFLALFRSRERMEFEAILRVANVVLLAAGVLSVLYMWPGILNLSYAYVAANAATLIVVGGLLVMRGDIPLVFGAVADARMIQEFFLIGLYLALSRAVGDITMHTDSVMLGYWGQMTEATWYDAASRVNKLVLFPMGLITTAVFPALVKAMHESKERLAKLLRLWGKVTVFLAVMLCSVVFVNADGVVRKLYPNFGDSQPTSVTLQILVLMGFLVYMTTVMYHVLLAADEQKKIFYVLLVGAGLNVVLNCVLIPRFSLYGAAGASAATHAAILVQYWVMAKRRNLLRLDRRWGVSAFAVPVVCGAVGCAVSVPLSHFGAAVQWAVLCGVVISCIAFVMFDRDLRGLVPTFRTLREACRAR